MTGNCRPRDDLKGVYCVRYEKIPGKFQVQAAFGLAQHLIYKALSVYLSRLNGKLEREFLGSSLVQATDFIVTP